jgi:hypothetical protein
MAETNKPGSKAGLVRLMKLKRVYSFSKKSQAEQEM